jgi:DNA-binding NarL/FixJ family response regulator
MPIRIALVDDHALVRAGLRALVEKLQGVEVVGEASDGREALKLIETSTPDIVLMDVSMHGLGGIEATARVAHVSPATRVIVVSMHTDPQSVLAAIEAGAAGYMSKDASLGELDVAIRSVVRGGTFLSPTISRHVLDDYRRRLANGEDPVAAETPQPGASERALLARLTPRQREILQLLAEGASSRKMARMLDVSIKTIETHRAQLMQRLAIHDVAGLVRFAIRAGLVRADVP